MTDILQSYIISCILSRVRIFIEKRYLEYQELLQLSQEFYKGGEGGIRTREPFQVTHIPGVRARPTTRPLHFF